MRAVMIVVVGTVSVACSQSSKDLGSAGSGGGPGTTDGATTVTLGTTPNGVDLPSLPVVNVPTGGDTGTAGTGTAGTGTAADPETAPDGTGIVVEPEPVDPEPEPETPDTGLAGEHCDPSLPLAGYLDPLQTAGDGRVVYCHSGDGSDYELIETDISSCPAHQGHAFDLFPTSGCDT